LESLALSLKKIRASSSISLNIAEDCSRSKTEDRKRFYAMARGSAMECAAISDLIIRIKPALANEVTECKKTLHSIACVLSTIILK
jgi:four helix bundle protein